MQRRALPRCVVLSPHLDDAALSLGGWIAELTPTTEVEVWTLFCGAPWIGPFSPLASWFHSACGGLKGRALFRLRTQEDSRAMKILGVSKWRHFRWLDAIYRKRSLLSFTYNDCRQRIWHQSDNRLVEEISKTLRSQLLPTDLIVAPLGVGRHVDHLIANDAVKRLQHRRTLWYTEVPYVQRFPDEVSEVVEGLHLYSAKCSVSSVSSWEKSVACYESQLPMLDSACGNILKCIRDLSEHEVHLWKDQDLGIEQFFQTQDSQ